MLNKNQERELAYITKVDAVRPIAGKDRVECAVVNGWTCMVRKGAFQPGSLGIYFEIDSKLDTSKPEFAFTEKYHGKIKTQKFKTPEGHFFSQGLLMAPEDFGWTVDGDTIVTDKGEKYQEGSFLTKVLKVTYADAEDNKRKAKSDPDAKYKSMMARHPKLAKSKFGKWAMKHTFMKKLLYLFLGSKSDKKKQWPAHIVKTDEERVQNLAHMLPEYSQMKWIATEKVDGTSTTFSLIKDKHKKTTYYVCSRNVVMNQPGKDKTCYYANTDGNVYLEMSNKYNMEDVLKSLITIYDDLSYVTIQGETYGGTIQKRDYSIKGHDLAVFNVIFGFTDGTKKRLNPFEGEALMKEYGIPYVPVLGEVTIADNCDDILEMAGGASKIDGLPREGLVFRTLDGSCSFKAVDNNFIVKYHS